jgi:hypothetical protein
VTLFWRKFPAKSPVETVNVRVADDRRWCEHQGHLDVHGHSSIQITLDKYGHLLPGSEGEAAEMLDAFLDRSNTAARLAQVAG